MNRLTQYLYDLFKGLVDADTAPRDYFGQVFDGNPFATADRAKPIIYIEPVSSTVLQVHGTYDKLLVSCAIGVSITEKLFYGDDDQNIVKVKRKLQQVLEKLGTNNIYDVDSIIGLLQDKKCFLDGSGNSVMDDINIVSTQYGIAQRQKGPVSYEGTVIIEGKINVFRS